MLPSRTAIKAGRVTPIQWCLRRRTVLRASSACLISSRRSANRRCGVRGSKRCTGWMSAVHRFDPATGRSQQWAVDELVGAIVVSSATGMLLAKKSGIARFNPDTGTSEPLVAPETPALDNRLNETKADRCGRLWTTTMRDYGAAVTGSLYRIDSALSVARMLSAIRVPNALAWSPDDRTMYFADTSDGRLRAYDFDRDA